MRRQQGAQTFDKVRLLQLAGADIDADRDFQSGGMPDLHLGQGGVDHPLAEFDGQRMILDHRQKLSPAAAGLVPDVASGSGPRHR